MSKFSGIAVKKLYFKQSFDNKSGNRGPLFSQINFDWTYFGGFCPGGEGYVPEPALPDFSCTIIT